MNYTIDAARALIKNAPARIKFALHVRVDAATDDKDFIFPDGCSTYLSLSRPQALGLVSRMLSETLENKGGRIKITQIVLGSSTTYWIG